MYVWLSLVLSCCPFSGLVGWLCQLPFFVSRDSEHVEYPENNFKLGGNLTEWHSTGLSPGSVPSLAFFLSISSIFFSARSMCVCLVVTGFVMFCPFSGLVGWLCQLPFLFPEVPSMSNTPKIISNLGEILRNGIPLGSLLEVFPALHSFFLFLPFSFQQEACVCLVVTGFVMFCSFSGLVVWLCQLPFLFPGVPSMSNTPKIISNLGEISRNGIPLCSLLEVFPALHSFFLFLPFSFQQEACVYVWLSLVLSCCPFSGLVGRLCQMAFHWALSWKRSQPCILPFYFFQRLFSKKHVFMFCRLLVCGTLRGKWLIYLIEVNA